MDDRLALAHPNSPCLLQRGQHIILSVERKDVCLHCVNFFTSLLSWEDCKQLLLSHNFFESLRFFDRDNVPRHKLQKLERIIAKKSELTSVERGSHAVVPICLWVQALVDYHRAKMVVQPYRERLAEAERTLLDVRLHEFKFNVMFIDYGLNLANQ